MTRVPSILGLLVVASSLMSAVPERAAADDSMANESSLRVYIDPATGKIAEPPAAVGSRARQAAEAAAVSSETEGLSVRQGTTHAGGVILDLGGRFQDEITVTREACGNQVSCKPAGVAGTSP